jgi:diacylglycerol O-acyltransferase
VGEPQPVRRLARIGAAMGEHHQSGRSVSAGALVALSGFAPPTLHALGARATNGLTRRMFSLVVTNVPGPQLPLYAAGARLTEMFPVLPLGPGQAVSIGLTSYDGGVFYGVNGDRDAMPDIEVLAALLEDSLAELVAASPAVAAPRSAGVVAGAAARVARRRLGAQRSAARAPRGPRP